MKASALHDGKGVFISTIGTVRDITDELGAELLRQSAAAAQDLAVSGTSSASKRTRLDKLLGKGRSNYKKGLFHYYREGNYPEAIRFFDQAIEIDPSLAAAWHDRGVCLRELGKDEDALKSIDKACRARTGERGIPVHPGRVVQKDRDPAGTEECHRCCGADIQQGS